MTVRWTVITLSFVGVVALLDKRYLTVNEMEEIHQKIPRQKQDSGDMPHPRPFRPDQHDVHHHRSNVPESIPGAWYGKLPRHKEKVVGGKHHLQTPSHTRDDVDHQSNAELTPGAVAVDYLTPPNDDDSDDRLDTIPKPLDRNVTSATQPSATEIVAHLAPDHNSEIEARIAERLEREMREMKATLEERLQQPFDHAIIVASQVNKGEENALVCGLQKRTMWILLVLLLLGVGGIVGGVVYSFGKDDATAQAQLDTAATSPTPAPNPTPATTPTPVTTPTPAPMPTPPQSPTPAPAQRNPLQELKPWIAPTEQDLLPFDDFSSPQSRALEWLNDDPITMSTGRATSVVLQRYVLAVFYFTTFGSGWNDKFDFMSDAEVCMWNSGTDPTSGGRGVFCSTDNKTIDWVDLKENNLQSLTVPWELFLLTNLKHIDLGSNRVEGTIPTRIDELTKLDHFDWSNNQLKGPLPTTMPSTMTYLYLNSNVLNGTIPSSWGERMPTLQYLYLEHNKLTGPLSTTMPSTMKELFLSNNSLTGTIPSSWGGAMPKLELLGLFDNQLTGPLPTTLSSTMTTLYLNGNALTGTIPSSWGASMPELEWLILSSNKLKGPLPTTMPSTMTYLDLFDNALNGTIPSGWGASMPELEWLILSSNKLKGPLPTTMPSTMTYLNLFDNALNGTIPSGWGASMPELEWLDLDSNQLTGPLPPTMPSTMINLYLSNNALTGTIPSSWGASMPKLQQLWLYPNQLTGTIPSDLSDIAS
jgi:hypothetical protein